MARGRTKGAPLENGPPACGLAAHHQLVSWEGSSPPLAPVVSCAQHTYP